MKVINFIVIQNDRYEDWRQRVNKLGLSALEIACKFFLFFELRKLFQACEYIENCTPANIEGKLPDRNVNRHIGSWI